MQRLPLISCRNARNRTISILMIMAFSVFSLVLPGAKAFASGAAGDGASATASQWAPKFQNFLEYEAGRAFLASVGESPDSFLHLVSHLQEDQQEQLWVMMAPVHPTALAVDTLVVHGYERSVAEEMIAKLSHEEVDAMVTFDHKEGAFGIGVSLTLIAVVLLVGLIVFLILDKKGMDQTASAQQDEQLRHVVKVGDELGAHLALLRAELGLEATL